MIFIADGGSTKADWRIIDQDGQQMETSTIGFNPFFFTSDRIAEELNKTFSKEMPVQQATRVYFYGSGCSDAYRCEIVAAGLRQIFPNAKVFVDHDLLASARATCGNEPGIACIMGTGSNSCLYDGESVTDNVTNLGYLLGDEGSGSHLGKSLLRGYFYREFPEEVTRRFKARYKFTKRELLNRIYEDEDANVFLASFARFLSDNKDLVYIQQIVQRAFSEFIDRHVRKYKGHNDVPIHFVGSVAYYFQDILEVVFAERCLKLGIIIKKPIDNLVRYHLQHEKVEVGK